jgi:hypothetical protein
LQPPAHAGSSLMDFFYPEDGSDTLLWNVGLHNIYTTPQPKRRHSSKIKLSLCVIKHNVMNIWGNGGIAPGFPNHATGWRRKTNFTPRHLDPWRKSFCYPLESTVDGRQSRSGHCDEKNLWGSNPDSSAAQLEIYSTDWDPIHSYWLNCRTSPDIRGSFKHFFENTGYGLHDLGIGVRVQVGSRIFSSPRRPDRLWGPPSLLSNRSFSADKAARAWSWPLTSN